MNAELADRLPVGDRTGAPRVLVTRAAEQAGPLVAALRETGLVVHAIPTIAFEPVEAGGSLDETAANLDRYDWVVVTSANGARAIVDAIARAGSDRTATRWAAVGTATATALVERGIAPDFVPASASGDAMADELPVVPGERVLLARGDLADGRLPDRLRERGATVDEVVAYRTREAPADSRQRLSEVISAGPLDAIVFTSGSTVRGLLALLTPQERRVALRSPAWCIGPSTAAVARESGFGRVNESPGRPRRPSPRRSSTRCFRRIQATQSSATETTPTVTIPRARSRPATRLTSAARASRIRGVPMTVEARARDPDARSGSSTPASSPHLGSAGPRSRDADPPPPARGPAVRPARPSSSGPRSRRFPGVSRLSPDEAVDEARALAALGVGGIILFGLPASKDSIGTGAWIEDGIVQETLRRIRDADLDLVLMADTCLCEYTDHGHCGPVDADGSVRNDDAIASLADTAASQARAGADVVAPSAMMDGQVAAIRAALDADGHVDTRDPRVRGEDRVGLLRPLPRGGRLGARVRRPSRLSDGSCEQARGDARDGDRPRRRGRHAPRQAGDALARHPRRRRASEFDVPIGAYQVSGEYAQIEAAARLGWIDRRRTHLEAATSIVRAGATFVITYAAADLATWLREGERLMYRPTDRLPEPAPTPRRRLRRRGRCRDGGDRGYARPSATPAVTATRPPGRPDPPSRGPLPGRRQQPGPRVPLRRAVPPLVLDAGDGPRVRDANGRWYIDYIGAWGPAILGHAHPARRRCRSDALPSMGLRSGATSPREVELGEAIRAADAVDGEDALHLVGNRSRDERDPPGPRRDRPRPRPEVRRRLSRPLGRPAGRGRARGSRRSRCREAPACRRTSPRRRSSSRTTTSPRSETAFERHRRRDRRGDRRTGRRQRRRHPARTRLSRGSAVDHGDSAMFLDRMLRYPDLHAGRIGFSRFVR